MITVFKSELETSKIYDIQMGMVFHLLEGNIEY